MKCLLFKTSQPGNQPTKLSPWIRPANSGGSKGKVGESGDSKFLMPRSGVKNLVFLFLEGKKRKTWRWSFIIDKTCRKECWIFFYIDVPNIIEGCNVARFSVSTPKCARGVTALHTSLEEKGMEKSLKKTPPIPSHPPTFLLP